MHRRRFLASLGAAGCAAGLASRSRLFPQAPTDLSLHLGPVEWEIAPKRLVKTIGYNGAVPGPVLRFRQGRPVTVEVINDTDNPEWVHWHGFAIPSEVDGAGEEGTPAVGPHSSRRFAFTPNPAGTRYYHAHGFAGRDLNRSTYTGQFGVAIIEPIHDPGAYDAEVVLALHGWDGYLSTMGADEGTLEAAYNHHTVNSHCLGFGEPVRVKEGRRVLFRIANASATLEYRLTLPGHSFTVLALDGNAVPTPRTVEALALGPGERVDALVTMNHPGVWVLGAVDPNIRDAGLGVVIEYADASGPPQWLQPQSTAWDYTLFGAGGATPAPLETIPLAFKPKFAGNRWVDHWTINGKSWPKTEPIRIRAGQRYRLVFDNQSDDPHPVHLHRHSFELLKVAGTPTSGVRKDVVVVPNRQQVEVELLANNPGPTLFHCHNQLHMDYGFMSLFEYA